MCLPGHVAMEIDLSDAAAHAKEGEWEMEVETETGFRPVAIFSLFSVYCSKGQKYLCEMHYMRRRQVSFN